VEGASLARPVSAEGALMNSLLISQARLVNSNGSLSQPVDIRIEDEAIVAVGIGLPHADILVCDAGGDIAIPGLVNAHTHAHNNLTKGMCDNWTLEDLRNYGSALFANRTADDQYLSAAIGAIEMLKTGCTAAYEQFVAVPMHTREGIDAVMQAYADVGIRAVIAPAFADISLYDAIPGLGELLPDDLRRTTSASRPALTEQMLDLSEAAIRDWDGKLHGRIRVATAPVIVGECSDALLKGCNRLSEAYGVGIHTHLAETKVQAISSMRRFGMSLVERLERLGVLGPRVVAAHSIWIDSEDIQRLGTSGAMVAHNPASNLKIGSGIAPVRELLQAGIPVGLGTDGSMASDNQNMFEAMRFAALVGKVRFAYQPELWLSAQEVFEMATSTGAKVLGLEGELGVLEVGCKADIVLLRARSSFLRPTNNVRNSLVYAETAADVRKVWVGGRLVVDDGCVLTVDEEDIYARAQTAVDHLMRQNKDLFVVASRLAPFVRSACAICAKAPMSVNRHAG
jgi:5-methylthioadenosine/S-adenosylhomocysteine deaminase